MGNMALLVTNFNITQSRHNEKNDLMKETVRYLGLPPELNKRIQEYFEYISIYSHPGVEGMQILQDLPTSLMQDVLEHMHKKIIERVPFFKDCEVGKKYSSMWESSAALAEAFSGVGSTRSVPGIDFSPWDKWCLCLCLCLCLGLCPYVSCSFRRDTETIHHGANFQAAPCHLHALRNRVSDGRCVH